MRSLFFAAALLILLAHNAMAQQSAQGSDILSDMKNAMGDVARDQVRLKTEKRLPDSAEAEGDYTRGERRYEGRDYADDAYDDMNERQRGAHDRRTEGSASAGIIAERLSMSALKTPEKSSTMKSRSAKQEKSTRSMRVKQIDSVQKQSAKRDTNSANLNVKRVKGLKLRAGMAMSATVRPRISDASAPAKPGAENNPMLN